MTDLMTAFTVILVQPTCPGDQRAKGVQFQSTCRLCRESHKTQVWLCFLVLSLLSTSTCAAAVDAAQQCIEMASLKPLIEKSDAMLYAPSKEDVKESCRKMSLKCYMLELVMVIIEEEIKGSGIHCILQYNLSLPALDTRPAAYPVDCPPCEAYPLQNITVFLQRFENLLEELNSFRIVM